MSAPTASLRGAARTLPPRAPDGFWRENRRYFWYVLFAGTGFVLSLACAELLLGVWALGRGFAAWQSYLAVLRSPLLVIPNLLLLIGTLYFAVRFLWVGVKIPTVALGPVPAPPAGLILVAHFAGFTTVNLALLILLSGVIV
jgi:fumarate reductase subunit C